MKGLPKRIATAEDIRNLFAMTKTGEIEKSALLEAMEELERQNYIHCPIREVSTDGKIVTVGYCAEATVDTEAVVGGESLTIKSIKHIEGEATEGENPSYETTEIGLSAKVSSDATEIGVTGPYNIYDDLGMTKEEFDEIKAALA